MDTHQFYDRKQYIEQVRNSFSAGGEKQRSYTEDFEADGQIPRNFFKVRFALAIVLFLAFLFIQQTNFSYKNVNAAAIVKQIKKTVALPESIPDIKELIRIQ